MGAKKGINRMYYDACTIRKVSSIRKTILSNTAYHSINLDKQLSSPNASMHYTPEERCITKVSRMFENFKANELMANLISLLKNDPVFLRYLECEEQEIYKEFVKMFGGNKDKTGTVRNG